jgi:hypothetical protein
MCCEWSVIQHFPNGSWYVGKICTIDDPQVKLSPSQVNFEAIIMECSQWPGIRLAFSCWHQFAYLVERNTGEWGCVWLAWRCCRGALEITSKFWDCHSCAENGKNSDSFQLSFCVRKWSNMSSDKKSMARGMARMLSAICVVREVWQERKVFVLPKLYLAWIFQHIWFWDH